MSTHAHVTTIKSYRTFQQQLTFLYFIAAVIHNMQFKIMSQIVDRKTQKDHYYLEYNHLEVHIHSYLHQLSFHQDMHIYQILLEKFH